MPRPQTLSRAQARRIVLAAQGLAAPRPPGRVDRGHLRKLFARLGLVQMDSVNVLVRAHYMPAFSRLGPYDRSLLDGMAYRDHELFEYWGHESSLIRADLEPLFRWRMREPHQWSGMRQVGVQHADLVEAVLAAVLERGPVSAGDLDAGTERTDPWWGWGQTKRVLEHLFHEGRVGAVRRGSFERAYCDPETVVPPAVRAVPTPDRRDALVALLAQASRAYGLGTAKDLAEFFRLPIREVRVLVEEMAAAGTLERVAVEGWSEPAYLDPRARLPRRVDACALVSPFDSVMWSRDRVERIFDFRYRIEIYLPAPQRTFGYYVLPFLLGDRYVARVDLKADRAGARLWVRTAHAEPGADEGEVALRLAGELATMAQWLGLDRVDVDPEGDLAPALTAAVR